MKNFKKVLAVVLVAVLAVSFAACGGKKGTAVKTGLAVTGTIDEVKDTTLTIDVVAAAVTVDADGKIVDIKIDEAQTKPDLAKADADYGVDLRTKYEKQGDYAMKETSAQIGNIQGGGEWFEQADAFMAWAKGKTAADIRAAVGADGKSTDADLTAGCTITITGIAETVAKAVESAADLGATTDDKLALNIKTEKYYESDGVKLLQYDSNVAAVTTDADGKITSCLIDAAQGKGTMADGKFTVKAGTITSKKDLKEDYNMKAVSAQMGVIPNGGEWYEQADAYQKWAIGKTADQIKAAVGEDGKSSDADLKAGCTITISSIAETVANAAQA
ncbi:MAG: FMN-binding protein [Eubacterium sp.]|nr:FMN-binding protein [Eubacterium sp.]